MTDIEAEAVSRLMVICFFIGVVAGLCAHWLMDKINKLIDWAGDYVRCILQRS